MSKRAKRTDLAAWGAPFQSWIDKFGAGLRPNSPHRDAMLRLIAEGCCFWSLEWRLFGVAYPELRREFARSKFNRESSEALSVAVDSARQLSTSLRAVHAAAPGLVSFQTELHWIEDSVKNIETRLDAIASEVGLPRQIRDWKVRAQWELVSFVEAATGQKNITAVEDLVWLACDCAGRRAPEPGSLYRSVNRYQAKLTAADLEEYERRKTYIQNVCSCDGCYEEQIASCECDPHRGFADPPKLANIVFQCGRHGAVQ